MDISDQATIFRFHNELIDKYGSKRTAALGWKDIESQVARFKVLSGIASLNGSSVLDAGCGHGDLYSYLSKKSPLLSYYGIEQIPALLHEATERYNHLPDTYFFAGDFSASVLPKVDYTIACGSLNYRNSDDMYIFKMIENLFYNSRIGLGFNLLKKIDPPHPLLESYDPEFVIRFCKNLSLNVNFTEGYFEADYTIFMYH